MMMASWSLVASGQTCNEMDALRTLQSSSTLVLRFSELATMDRRVLFDKLNQRQEFWRSQRDRFAEDPGAIFTLYQGLRNKMPQGGYYRAVGASEIIQTLGDGRIQLGQYFAYKDQPARVGHNANFVFLRCSRCPAEWFTEGNTGSGVVNTYPIKASDLEVIIP